MAVIFDDNQLSSRDQVEKRFFREVIVSILSMIIEQHQRSRLDHTHG